MSLILNQHINGGTKILIWKDEESIDYFLSKTRLTNKEIIQINAYTVERRKKELIIARYLLQTELPNAEITYLDNGKPYIRGGEAYLSISHTKDLVAIIINPHKQVSIDIEYINHRVEKVKQRFLSEQELTIANTTELLTLYWSAKECLFKLDDKQGLDFRTDLSISPYSSRLMTGHIRKDNAFKINYEINKDWVLCYSLK